MPVTSGSGQPPIGVQRPSVVRTSNALVLRTVNEPLTVTPPPVTGVAAMCTASTGTAGSSRMKRVVLALWTVQAIGVTRTSAVARDARPPRAATRIRRAEMPTAPRNDGRHPMSVCGRRLKRTAREDSTRQRWVPRHGAADSTSLRAAPVARPTSRTFSRSSPFFTTAPNWRSETRTPSATRRSPRLVTAAAALPVRASEAPATATDRSRMRGTIRA